MTDGHARELNRRLYLDAMGIDSYVSRYALPGAAPGRPLDVVVVPKPARQAAAPPIEPSPPADDIAALRNLELAGSGGSMPRQAVAPPRATAPTPEPFTVVVSIAGGWLWLDGDGCSAVTDEYVRLLGAIVQALGRGSATPQTYQFNWPLHDNARLDLGEDAARQALQGFVERRLGEADCEGVVVMGDVERHGIQPAALSLPRQLHSVSLFAMLRDPQLKPRAWQQLQDLVAGQ